MINFIVCKLDIKLVANFEEMLHEKKDFNATKAEDVVDYDFKFSTPSIIL